MAPPDSRLCSILRTLGLALFKSAFAAAPSTCLREAVCLLGALSAQTAAPFPAAAFIRSRGMLTAQSPHSS